MLFQLRSFKLGFAVDGTEQVFGIGLIFDALEARSAEAGQQDGHDDEVARPLAHLVAQPSEKSSEAIVDEIATGHFTIL